MMSLEASDVPTEEDCDDLGEDVFSFSADMLEHEKQSHRKRRSSGKPPSTPRSPYLSSLNVNPRREAVSAWRPLRTSPGESRGERDTPGETSSARLTSLSNGYGLSQTLRSECDATPELLKHSHRKHRLTHSSSNGYTPNPADYREKEDMYDEIIHLKKSLQAQKSDGQQLKAKLRRLEEDNGKRERQIEELLDPTRASEYTRSLVDRKRDGSVVINGLKQRILKLEQQFREKENALSNLQSELRTTNLEDLRRTVETYFEEIQKLRILLEAAEKSSRAESKGSQKQQKALSCTVLRLSENLKQVQQENTLMREELNTDSPAGGVRGYREWSKQRLLRRLLELEKRLEDSRKHAHSARSSGRLDREVQTMPSETLDVSQGVTAATGAVFSVGTAGEEGEELVALRGRVSQSEKESEELKQTLKSRDEELKRLTAERVETERETERWRDEQTSEREKERQEHRQQLEQLHARIQILEEEKKKTKDALVEEAPPAASSSSSSSSATTPGSQSTTHGGAEEEGGGGGGGRGTEGGGDNEALRGEAEEEEERRRGEDRWRGEREDAARTIQAQWRRHRARDVVMLQSALRGHLRRHRQLRDPQRDAHSKAALSKSSGDVTSSAVGDVDVVAVTMMQSVFRGHLARCGLATESSEFSVPSPMGSSVPTPAPRRTLHTHTTSKTGPASLPSNVGHGEEDLPVRRKRHAPAQLELRPPPDSGAARATDSDDSDDIIVSPSRPLRSREASLF